MWWPVGESVNRILDDFVYLGVAEHGVLVTTDADPRFAQGVVASAIATQLGIGLGYALNRYTPDEVALDVPALYGVFREAYKAGKRLMREAEGRFSAGAAPIAGEVYSFYALRRLPATYAAAGLMFRTGRLFEAHALCRVFVEQVAWSYAIRKCESYGEARRVRATRSVSALAEVMPHVGPLYGALSEDTHLELDAHDKFLRFSPGEFPRVVLAHGDDSLEAGLLMLPLADMWVAIFELTQRKWMSSLETWTEVDGELVLDEQRPVLELLSELRTRATALTEPA